jgi:hypothetical protein
MAAAPNLPVPENALPNITVDNTYTPTPQGIVVGQGDPVTFYNNSGVDILIEFQTNVLDGQNQTPVYAPMNLPVSDGDSNGFTAPNANCAANYYIYNADVTPPAVLSGPFVIQVGSGPMYVNVTQSNNVLVFTPDAVAVPLGNAASGAGYLEINSEIPNTVVPIYWATTDPFNPGITESGPPQPVQTGTAPGEYDYSNTPSPVGLTGGGKVIIQS